jgi:hypothetical protein
MTVGGAMWKTSSADTWVRIRSWTIWWTRCTFRSWWIRTRSSSWTTSFLRYSISTSWWSISTSSAWTWTTAWRITCWWIRVRILLLCTTTSLRCIQNNVMTWCRLYMIGSTRQVYKDQLEYYNLCGYGLCIIKEIVKKKKKEPYGF